MNKRRGGLVYSTEHGRTCPACGRPIGSCACRRSSSAGAASGGPVRIRRETKGRKGKGVTIVEGLALAPADLADLARRLKRTCGSGGTVRDGAIEIQGDHRETLAAELARDGWKVRGAG